MSTRLERLIHLYVTTKDANEANQLAGMVEAEADRVGYSNHHRLKNIHTLVERNFYTEN
jgi:hypothetical protein